MNLSLSGATDFVKDRTPGIKVFIPKLIFYHIHEKSMYIFTETIRLLCVSCQFSRVFVFVFYIFQLFNFCQPRHRVETYRDVTDRCKHCGRLRYHVPTFFQATRKKMINCACSASLKWVVIRSSSNQMHASSNLSSMRTKKWVH